MEKEDTKSKAPVRPKRRPVATRQRLEVLNLDPNRSYRLIDATSDRIQMFEDAGYKIEPIKEHLRGGQRTDTPSAVDNAIAVGGGKKQILVSIEKEFYEEDQKAKSDMIDAREAGIKGPNEGQYGQVKVTEELRRRST